MDYYPRHDCAAERDATVTDLEDRLTRLEERLQAFEDKEAILRTIYQYSHSLDHALTADDFVDCFTETALWWSSTEGRYAGTKGGIRLEGRDALRTWFMGRGRGTPEWQANRGNSKHYIVGPKIQIDGDEASAESYMLAVRDGKDGPYIWAMARYFDRLIRCDDGRWRFQERHLAREGAAVEAQSRPVG